MATSVRIDAGNSGLFSGTLRKPTTVSDPKGDPIPLSEISTLVLNFTDAATGTAVNSRTNQDVKNDHGVVVHATSGALAWTIAALDTTPLDLTVPFAEHIADFVCTYDSGKVLRFQHRIVCRSFLQLCTVEDVKLLRPSIVARDLQLIELYIDGVSARFEQETGRRLRRATDTQVFSIDPGQTQIRVRRYPIESVTSIKIDGSGAFSAATALDSDGYDFAAMGHKGIIESRDAFDDGIGNCQVVYVGGYRDVASVPSDLRAAAAKQVAYNHQRKDQLGISGESIEGKSISYAMALDLLPDVQQAFLDHAPKRI